MRFTVIALFLISFLLPAQDKQPIVASDVLKIATANQISISPDGSKAVMVVTRKAVKNESDYYYTNHLYVIGLSGKYELTQLTFGDKNDSQPQWSPDGQRIAFVRKDGKKSQIWLLPLAGGEAQVLTNAKFGATRPRWSPDGSRILFISNIYMHAIDGTPAWPNERPGRKEGDEPNFKAMNPEERKAVKASMDGGLEEVRAWLARNATENNPRVITRLNLQGELDLQPGLTFTHIFVQDAEPGSTAGQLTSGFQNFQEPEWSRDGKKIICQSKVNDVFPDRVLGNDLWMIDVRARTASEFLAWENYSLSSPQYAPGGDQISFMATNTENRHATQSQLAVVSSSGGKPLMLTSSHDRDISGAVWAPDSKTLYFTSSSEGDIQLFRVPSKGGAITKVYGGDNGVNDFDVRGDKIVYALTETRNPWEVYLHSTKDKSHRQLTQLNEWVKDREITHPKEYWFTRPDGTKIQYWVMEPVGRKEGMKYPTILNIHGGPAAMWGPGIFSMWHEFQLEASWGYGIVYCNPRGSGGYGDKFKKANYRDWGTGPAGDILASLDEAMKGHIWIDKDNLFVEGGSYAGYMVAWIIAHDQRFKAANAQRGVYELTTFMGEGNAWRLVPNSFGYPWEEGVDDILKANSPYTYVHQIKTPLLIIHGDQDLRTGVTQSEMLYKSLKILSRPVEYVRYPREGHELTRSGNPGRMMDHLLRIIEFFERYAQHPEPPPATMVANR